MADVTGPISTLSGAHHPVPNGQMCDDHEDRPAIARIQGETAKAPDMTAERAGRREMVRDTYRQLGG